MRCPTTKFWGSEIYNKTNRLGRYQAHGTLEVVYDGTIQNSGYPKVPKAKNGGWDWNVVPGATTVHYSSWKEMMPNKNAKDRFDQYALTTNFSGALSWGDCGVFAAVFDQGDSWGKERFEPTNLTFCKSVFAFDGVLVALGTGISAQGNYANDRMTATNLFQSVLSPKSKELVVDGQEVKEGNSLFMSDSANGHWLVTPNGTGYYLPAGNDSLVVKYGEQSSPASSGQEALTTLTAAKAYLNHGVKPLNKNYCFMVVPDVTPVEMGEKVKQLQESGTLFDIKATEDSIHVIKHKPSNTIAYALFVPAKALNYGVLRSTSSELLLMERLNNRGEELEITMCNPNLRPQAHKKYGWVATPTEVSLLLDGVWKLGEGQDQKDGLILSNTSSQTVVKAVLKEGFSLSLNLERSKF